MTQPKSKYFEKRIVQGLFVVVLLTFLFAERAQNLLNSRRATGDAATVTRATRAAAVQQVAFQP